MTDHRKEEKRPRYLTIKIAIGYLFVQAFLLMLVTMLPWPIVDVYSWVHTRESVTPDPIWAFFCAQLAIGLFLPLRGKVFLMGQLIVFTLAFLLLGDAETIPGQGDRAVVPPEAYTIYWFQFFATALGLISWRYRRSKALPWYPLIAYFAMQTIILWGVTEIRLSVGASIGDWILLVFLGQCIGLLFVPNRVRLVIATEVLLGVSIARLKAWLPTGWNGPSDFAVDGLWVVYFLQCAGLLWWHMSRPKKDRSKSAPSTIDCATPTKDIENSKAI